MTPRRKISQLLIQLREGTELDACEASKRLTGAKGEKVVAELCQVLRSAVRPHSREGAAYALSYHTSRSAIPALLESAANSEELEAVRGQAMEGLAQHLCDDPIGSELRAKAEDLLMRLLQSPSPILRFWSCFGLGRLRCERSAPALLELSKKDTVVCPGWWYIREEVEDALEWIAGRPGVDRVPVHQRNADNSPPSCNIVLKP